MKFRLIPLLVLLAWIGACKPASEGEYYSIQGFTQGTTYRITYQHPTLSELQEEIDLLLRAFDSSLSSYDST
ncbi:MAG: FAD:protein FMN transferase, partial [Bacteroidetes bacterium]